MLVDWRKVWLYPTAAAGLILLVFVALFRNNVDASHEVAKAGDSPPVTAATDGA